jgi:hypothetical protein
VRYASTFMYAAFVIVASFARLLAVIVTPEYVLPVRVKEPTFIKSDDLPICPDTSVATSIDTRLTVLEGQVEPIAAE